MKKIIFTIIIVVELIACWYSCSYAKFDENISIWDMGKEWIEIGNNSKPTKMGKTGYWSVLAGLLTSIGVWVIIISGMILGIRFMVSSPDNKAEVKKALRIWLIGTVIILGALSIWKLLISILDVF